MKKIFSFIFDALLLCTNVFLAFQLFTLNVLPTKFLIPIVCISLLLSLIFCILSIKSKKAVSTTIVCILCLVLSCGYGFAGYYLHKTNQTLKQVTTTNQNENKVSIVVLKDASINELKDIANKKVGQSSTMDPQGCQYLIEDVNSKKIQFESVSYDSIQNECMALYSQEVDAILVNETYRDSISDLEQFINFDEETKVIYTYTYESEKQETVEKVEDVTLEPFNILITGTDSREGVNAVSRSDVNMVATVNPKTGTVLLTSIPRDYYVPEVCDASEGCPNGQLDKLTHTGNHGMSVVKKTIESFMGIKINYTIKVSFESVINIVDALGGIDIYSEIELTNAGNGNTACPTIHKGENHVDGQCALGFARERYSYENGDRQRIKNQQTVLIAIAKKATSPSMIMNYPKFMEALQGTFVTDLTTQEIQDLIQYQISSNKDWTFEQYSLNGTGDWGFSAEMGQDLYMMYPDQVTVDTARKKIEAVLNGQSSKTIQETEHDEIEIVDGWQGY